MADAARLGSLGRFLTPEPAGEPRVPCGTANGVTNKQMGATAKASIIDAQSRAMPKSDAPREMGERRKSPPQFTSSQTAPLFAQTRSFAPDQPNVRFAPKAVIRDVP